jgi:hypothetical protein
MSDKTAAIARWLPNAWLSKMKFGNCPWNKIAHIKEGIGISNTFFDM